MYYCVDDAESIIVSPPRDCTIEVEAWFEDQWGYQGGDVYLSVELPQGLTELARVDGRIYGGNIVGRTLHAFLACSGATNGQSYNFAVSLTGSGTSGFKHIVARCLPC